MSAVQEIPLHALPRGEQKDSNKCFVDGCEWINKMRMRTSHSPSISGTVKYSPAIKRNEVLRPAPTWMNPGNVRRARGWSPRAMCVE